MVKGQKMLIGYVVHKITKKPDTLLVRRTKAGAIKAFEYQLCQRENSKEAQEYKKDCRTHTYKVSEVFIED